MIRKNSRSVKQAVTKPQNMVGAPTVVPSSDVVGNIHSMQASDDFFGIEVDTGTATANQKVVLFDASQGYQLANGYTVPNSVVISGTTANYQFILNDIAHNASFFDYIKMRVAGSGAEAPSEPGVAQFPNPLEVYSSSKGSGPKLVTTLYPEKGIHGNQFQTSIATFLANLTVDNRIALVYTQIPKVKCSFSFYQKAEIGRKQ